jgi:hypothetical protein
MANTDYAAYNSNFELPLQKASFDFFGYAVLAERGIMQTWCHFYQGLKLQQKSAKISSINLKRIKIFIWR